MKRLPFLTLVVLAFCLGCSDNETLRSSKRYVDDGNHNINGESLISQPTPVPSTSVGSNSKNSEAFTVGCDPKVWHGGITGSATGGLYSYGDNVTFYAGIMSEWSNACTVQLKVTNFGVGHDAILYCDGHYAKCLAKGGDYYILHFPIADCWPNFAFNTTLKFVSCGTGTGPANITIEVFKVTNGGTVGSPYGSTIVVQ